MNKVQLKNRFIIFTIEAVCMIIELCASYIISPYFGNGNIIWTCIIGTILLANSLGNYIGGLLSDKNKDYISRSFLFSAVFLAMICVSKDIFLSVISGTIENTYASGALAIFLLFFPCEVALGTVPPQIMNRESKRELTGKTQGIVYSLSTLGGLSGTVLGGFVLIPSFGCHAVLVISLAIICVLFLGSIDGLKKRLICCVVSILLCGFASIFSDDLVFNDNYKMFDTKYNRVVIIDDVDEHGDNIRVMSMSAGFESMTYTDEGKRYDLSFEYCKRAAEVAENYHDILMIGGAGYQFPKYILANTDKNIDVVEIDGDVTELAKKYFYLQDCLDEFDAAGDRCNLITDDGKVYVANTDKKYDMIFNDAFAGEVPVASLSTYETMLQIKNVLTENGIYCINILGSADSTCSSFARSEINTLKKAFKHVYVLRANGESDPSVFQNLIVIATDSENGFINDVEFDFSDAVIITDDYCPVNKLAERDALR